MKRLGQLSTGIALLVALSACGSAEQQALNDEVKVAEGIEAVCDARLAVDNAIDSVNALTPESTVADARKANKQLNSALASLDGAKEQLAKAEVREYRDQVQLFKKAVNNIGKKDEMTLAEAADQLKSKAIPLIAARDQMTSTTMCIEVESSPNGDAESEMQEN